MLSTSQNYTVEDSEMGLRFVFPYRNEVFSTGLRVIGGVFSIASLAFWAFISYYLMFDALQDHGSFFSLLPLFLFFAIVLAVGLAAMVGSFMEIFWRLKGEEIVEISAMGVSIHHRVFRFRITRVWEAEKISCLFLSRHKTSRLDALYDEARFGNFKRGKIGFNNGKTLFGAIKTFRFGSILDQGEAKQVLGMIYTRFPRYKCVTTSAN
jgi:hypothetical protein